MKTIADIANELGLTSGGVHGIIKCDEYPSGKMVGAKVFFTDEEYNAIIETYSKTRLTKKHRQMIKDGLLFTSTSAADRLGVSRDMFLTYVEKHNVPYETKSCCKIFTKATIDGLVGKRIRKYNKESKPKRYTHGDEEPIIKPVKRAKHPCTCCGKTTTNYFLCEECYRLNGGVVGSFEESRSVSF